MTTAKKPKPCISCGKRPRLAESQMCASASCKGSRPWRGGRCECNRDDSEYHTHFDEGEHRCFRCICSAFRPMSDKKPKHVSKTKQELRRLREFASLFTAPGRSGLKLGTSGHLIAGGAFDELRSIAAYALTGKKEAV